MRDRFELVSHLATGGMAELFLARRRDADPGEPCVVLKRILPEHARNPGFVAMFLDEARLAARLVHPNIAALLDVGRTGTTYFYTLEYVHGQNLRDVLQTAARAGLAIPPGVAIAIVCGAAAGLHAAHEQHGRDGRPLEIVHRDVSPSNVMVAYDGTIKVVDFGVAKAADRMTETRSGTVKGKIAYLSPEQALLRDLDRTSDVFSLGIVAWELATQRRLFKRQSDYETMRAIIDEPIPRADEVAPAVSAALADAIAGALERGLDRRYPSAAAFAAALGAVADRAGWARDAAAVAATMRALFGAPPLPWLEAERESTDTGVIPLTAIDVIELLDDEAAPPAAPAVTARIVPARPAKGAAVAAVASTPAALAAVTAPVVRIAPAEVAPAPA
ncbi:MAG: serine/threonine protein kinase, partial [Myxococcales bacterium]|nr:serine/threonine protein kinase [Myxococcales bacterium]